MAIHTELRPDDASLPLLLADVALRQSNANVTRISGMLSVDNGNGSETWIGGNVNSDSNGGVTKWIGDTTVPGKPTGLSAVSTVNRVLVSWNGTLHDGVPADFDHISVFVVEGGAVASLGDLNCAGTILSKKYAEGTILEVYAVAYDAARDEQGNPSPNVSEESDRIILVVERDVDMDQLNDAAADMEQKADAAAAKADQVRSDLQAEVDKVKAKADDLSKTGDQLAGQITDIKGTVNGQQTKLTEFGQKLEGEITRGDTTVKSVSELKQTVTGLSSTVSQTTKTASDALSKATSVEQTANGLKATISKDYTSTKNADLKYSTKAELSATSDSLSSKITETTKTANGAMDKASSVEQTASGLSVRITEAASEAASAVQTANSLKSTVESNTANITQVGKTADGLVTRTSSLEQNLSGFKSEVSQTYTPRTDFDNLSIGGTNLLADSNLIKTYIDPSTGMPSDANASQPDDDWTGDSCTKTPISVSPSTQYTLSAYDDMADTTFTGRVSQLDSDGNLIGLLVDSITFLGPDHVTFTTAANAASIHVGIYLAPKCKWKLEKGGKPTDWSPAPEDYSTKSYVDQQSKSIALGVVQSYKGADGSGLATKSDITVEHERITSEVSGKYATKDGVTEEISSKVTQNNESLDVKFATKVENQSTLDAANTAQSNASDAQSRVGTLEDCISLTSAGVRAGHQSNGVFDGVSALVNTDGSFDLLDKDGNLLTRIYRHGLQVAGDTGVGSGHLILSQDGLDITVQPTANEKVTYHIQLGAGGISITAPDGAHVECSARTGLDLETVKYGKLSIGSGGLQFTNDQGWGLALSAAGWSLKWAGNHTLATGPTAGALYIDGRQIVTR
ncbi:hypothetical protein ACEWFV_05870 [Bifidobacterium hominis]|uniref:hypothetical protein n=1 Tax=Bifidobacterium hominis TaxID=3133177 RepID=UPI003CFE96FD